MSPPRERESGDDVRNQFRRLPSIYHIQFTSILAQYCSTHAKPVCVCVCMRVCAFECVRVRASLDSFFCPAVRATIYAHIHHNPMDPCQYCLPWQLAFFNIVSITTLMMMTHLRVAQRNLFFIAHRIHNQFFSVCMGWQHIFYRIVTFLSLLNLNKMLHN